MSKLTKPVISFWDRTPPLAALAVAKLGGVDIDVKVEQKGSKDASAILTLPGGETFAGAVQLKYLAATGSARSLLVENDALNLCQVDQWLEYSKYVVNGAGLAELLQKIDAYLSLRTFLVGYGLSVADISIWGQLKGAAQWTKLRGSGTYPHLNRWFEFISTMPAMKEVEETYLKKKGNESNPSGGRAEGQSTNKGESGSFNIDLPNAMMGKVVTRFPPEPSGYLHIGHAKAALLNQYISESYKGQLIVRFDDTNPSKEKDEYVENILKDIDDLGLKYDLLTYTSDYFKDLQEMAVLLIKAGNMYADDTPVDVMRNERMEGIESKCRNRSVEENLQIWKEMQRASEIGLKNCMRFKIDMQAPNKALRDPVAYRCNLEHHWRTGNTYKVYPTYDCACPYVDSVEGVTHALRTSEYKDREAQFQWVLSTMQKLKPGMPNVDVWEYSRLNFVNTVLSKRKLKWFVETGRVSGWDDPRFPTVQGMLRRGMTLAALKEFILMQGASKNITLQTWEKIWTINKKVIDPVCARHTAVDEIDRVPVTLIDGPKQPEVVTLLRHKKHPPTGKKALTRSSQIWMDQADAQIIKPTEEVTLMDWGNCIIQDIQKDEKSGKVLSISARLNLAGDFKKTKWKLTWLAQLDELLPLFLVDFDHLITKKKLEEEDDFESFVNPNTWMEKAAVGDPNMRVLNKGEIIQLERKGYYIVDKPYVKPGVPMVLFNIPDGRMKKSSK